MAKKLAGVAADMIGTAAVAQAGAARVPNEFRRRFRGYAASHDMKLNEVLYKAFEALLQTSP